MQNTHLFTSVKGCILLKNLSKNLPFSQSFCAKLGISHRGNWEKNPEKSVNPFFENLFFSPPSFLLKTGNRGQNTSFPQSHLWKMWTKIVGATSFPRFPQGFPQEKVITYSHFSQPPFFSICPERFVVFAQKPSRRKEFCTLLRARRRGGRGGRNFYA